MENRSEQFKFEIEPTIEQTPFKDSAVRAFFKEWCRINDSIEPKFVSRKEWLSSGRQANLEKNWRGNKRIVYIPKDLQLWEMVGIMEVVDKDTFKQDVEKQSAAKKELQKLGEMFQDAAIYIARASAGLKKGKAIAEALALEFYTYGYALSVGQKPEHVATIDFLLRLPLPPQKLETIDRWLAGDELYASRLAKINKLAGNSLENKEDLVERERQNTLSQFFGIAESAFELEKIAEDKAFSSPTDGLALEPWHFRTPIHSAFLERVKKELGKKIQAPRRELENVMFRRGMELLQRTIGVTSLSDKAKQTIDHWNEGAKTLREALKIDSLREELAEVRKGIIKDPRAASQFATSCEQLARTYLETSGNTKVAQRLRDIGSYSDEEVKRSGISFELKLEQLQALHVVPAEDIETLRKDFNLETFIGDKEREITDKIQKAVSSFPYEEDSNRPAKMIATKYINCVGASMLAGAFLSEVGISYLVADVPNRSLLFLVSTDGVVQFREMLSSSFDEELVDDMIVGTTKDKRPLTVADIVAFSKKPDPQGQSFDITDNGIRKFYSVPDRGFSIIIQAPMYGQQLQVLNNTGNYLSRLGHYDQAIIAYREGIALNPKNPYLYHNLGNVLLKQKKYAEAMGAYKQSIQSDPHYVSAYNGLGEALATLGRDQEAVQAYNKAIAIYPRESHSYYNLGLSLQALGKKKEAIDAYRKYIFLADVAKDRKWMKLARKKIMSLAKTKEKNS